MPRAYGYRDEALVETEPFTQWVIEDRFAGERPDFAAAGVTLTDDVAPWEEAKLRLLNGAHSTIAYLGGLGGIAHVHEFVAGAERRALIDAPVGRERGDARPRRAGIDVAAYRAALMARFANPALRHRTRADRHGRLAEAAAAAGRAVARAARARPGFADDRARGGRVDGAGSAAPTCRTGASRSTIRSPRRPRWPGRSPSDADTAAARLLALPEVFGDLADALARCRRAGRRLACG